MHLLISKAHSLQFFVEIPLRQFISHLFRPIRGGAAAVIFVFAILTTFLLSMASSAGVFILSGLPLAVILVSWFFKYAYILFDRAAAGFDDPPVLDIQMVNPLNEQRPIGQVAIAAVVAYGVFLTDQKMGGTFATLIAMLAVLFLPASVAVLGIEGNALKAANPVEWIRLAVGMGPLYAVVLAVISGYALLLALTARLGIWLLLQISLSMFAILSIFSVLGGFVYERRDELGIEAWTSPERTHGIRQQEILRNSERQVTEAYGKVRAGSHVEAWQMLQSWLAQRGFAPDDYRWLCGRVGFWEDARYIRRLTEEHIERLLALKRNGEALGVAAQRVALDPSFRPRSAESTLQIAKLAAVGGGTKGLARTLVSDFSTRFPGDPRIRSVASLVQDLAP